MASKTFGCLPSAKVARKRIFSVISFLSKMDKTELKMYFCEWVRRASEHFTAKQTASNSCLIIKYSINRVQQRNHLIAKISNRDAIFIFEKFLYGRLDFFVPRNITKSWRVDYSQGERNAESFLVVDIVDIDILGLTVSL